MEASISSSPETYAGIIQVLDTVDESSRKSMKEELLKEAKSQQNVETKAKKVIDENDGLRLDVKDKVDKSKETVCVSAQFLGCASWNRGSAPRRCKADPRVVQRWLKAQEASRNSQEEPLLKKKKLEEKTGNQNDEAKEGLGVNEPMSDGLTEFLAKHAERIADGTAAHQFDYMSPKPFWFPERNVNSYGPCVKW